MGPFSGWLALIWVVAEIVPALNGADSAQCADQRLQASTGFIAHSAPDFRKYFHLLLNNIFSFFKDVTLLFVSVLSFPFMPFSSPEQKIRSLGSN